MGLLSVIRRWRLRDGKSIREIARRTGLSRNTVRKYLVNGELEPKYPKRRSRSKLDEYAGLLASWLEREAKHGRKHGVVYGSCISICADSATAVRTIGLPRLPERGERSSRKQRRSPVAGRSCRWCLRLRRRFNSTGAKSGR